MMPWREQLRLAWKPACWVIWAPLPVWANIVMKIAQAVACLGVVLGSAWIVLAAVVLVLVLAWAVPLP